MKKQKKKTVPKSGRIVLCAGTAIIVLAAVISLILTVREEKDAARNVEPYQIICGVETEGARFSELVVSPDSALILGAAGNELVMFRAADGAEIYRVEAPVQGRASGIEFSEDGRLFMAICGGGAGVQIWRTEDGSAVLWRESAAAAEAKIGAAGFISPESFLVSDAGTVYLETLAGEGRQILDATHASSTYDREFTAQAYLNNGFPEFELRSDGRVPFSLNTEKQIMVTGGRDGNSPVYVTDFGGRVLSILDTVASTDKENFSVSPDGKYVAGISDFGFFGLWTVSGGKSLGLYGADTKEAVSCKKIVFSPDSGCMAFVLDSHLYMYLIDKLGSIWRADIENAGVTPELAFSPNGAYLLVSNGDIQVFNAYSGELLATVSADGGCFENLAISPDGAWFFADNTASGGAIYKMPPLLPGN